MLRFADRRFYGNWWSSRDTVRYFSAWNHIIKHWIIEYTYVPLIKRGASPMTAGLLVSLGSALLHDYVYLMGPGFVIWVQIAVISAAIIPGLIVARIRQCFSRSPGDADATAGAETEGKGSEEKGSCFLLQVLGTTVISFFLLLEYWSRVNCPSGTAAAGNATLVHLVTDIVIPRSLSCLSFNFTIIPWMEA